MNFLRRRVLLAASALLPAMPMPGKTGTARAETTDLVVICDPPLAAPLGLAGAAFRARAGVHLRLFPTAPGLIVPQLAHDVQNDLIVTQLGVLDEAARAGLLAGARSGNWGNQVVVAELVGAAGPAGSGKFAVSELAGASGIEGAAIAARLGVATARILSAIDTPEVAFLLTSGVARTGLLYLTDVRGDPRLRVVYPVADQPPAIYAAALSKHARRPNPAAFLDFLATAQARELLVTSGLEPVT